MLTFLFEFVMGWFTDEVTDKATDKVTDPGSPATRAADAYESATVLRNGSEDPQAVLAAQLARYKVAEQYADPDSAIGHELFESFQAGVKPRKVKRWLNGLEA